MNTRDNLYSYSPNLESQVLPVLLYNNDDNSNNNNNNNDNKLYLYSVYISLLITVLDALQCIKTLKCLTTTNIYIYIYIYIYI